MDFEITPEEVKTKLENRDRPVLLDIRDPWEYATAHIEGSKHIPMDELPSRAAELDPTAHIVVFCHAGVRSAHVTEWLRQSGFDKVQSMRGGIDRWSRTVDPSVPVY
jgi:rhodanese-related sulfurtransferase